MYFQVFIDSFTSFMYMRNNKGPKIETSGMPYLVVWISDVWLLIIAYWVLPLRYFLKKSKATLLMP